MIIIINKTRKKWNKINVDVKVIKKVIQKKRYQKLQKQIQKQLQKHLPYNICNIENVELIDIMKTEFSRVTTDV